MKTVVQMKKVKSSNIESIGYNDSKNLFIRFKGNAIYKYDNVSRETNDKLMESQSKGKFIHSNIKGIYECTNITASKNLDFEFVDIKDE